jgi:predicted transcriptional regulator
MLFRHPNVLYNGLFKGAVLVDVQKSIRTYRERSHGAEVDERNDISGRRRARNQDIRRMNVKLRKIEVDDATATALEARAAAAGVSVSQLIAQLVSLAGGSAKVSSGELDELDRQWAAIKAGEPTIAHDDVVRWLDTWGTPGYRVLPLHVGERAG